MIDPAGLTPAVFRCRVCGAPFTGRLVPLADRSVLNPTAGEPYLPRGSYYFSDEDFAPAGVLVVHPGDLTNARLHPDPGRRNGCCGLDGCDGPNRVCPEGHAVATERSDCWMAHHAVIDPTGVILDPSEPGPAAACLGWNGGVVAGLAESIARGRTFRLLPVLADALEDADCRDSHLLGHLRRGMPHRDCCWVTELLLGRRGEP